MIPAHFISFHFIHFISYSRYKKGHAHNQLYDLLGAILEEVDDICYSISKKNIMCFKGGEYNKMLKKIVTRKRGNLSLEQVVEVFLKVVFTVEPSDKSSATIARWLSLLFRVLNAGLLLVVKFLKSESE